MVVASIYKITNTLNQKCYIGFTRQNVTSRWNKHKRSAFKPKLECPKLYRAFLKYGEEVINGLKPFCNQNKYNIGALTNLRNKKVNRHKDIVGVEVIS